MKRRCYNTKINCDFFSLYITPVNMHFALLLFVYLFIYSYTHICNNRICLRKVYLIRGFFYKDLLRM